MPFIRFFSGRTLALAAAVTAGPFIAGVVTAGDTDAAAMHEITITISKVKALDQIDIFSKGDFFARGTIDADVQTTPVAKQQSEIAPNWKISHRVAPGKHTLKLELFDKDLTKNDPIDVNPLNNNRVLEATIDTRKCRITGYNRTYRCGNSITVSGNERKAAAITFSVDVKK